MRRTTTQLSALAAVAALLAGCASPGPGPAVRPPGGAWALEKIGEFGGFDVPESVLVDPASGTGYVSNVSAPKTGEGDARFWADDGAGFISRLRPGGEPETVRWRTCGAEAPLNAPKGMCLLAGELWVADNTRLARFTLAGCGKGDQIALPNAGRLNDMATDGQHVYVSDCGTNRIYRVTSHGYDAIPAPRGVNGITFAKGRCYAVSWDLHEVYEIDVSGAGPPRPLGVAPHFSNLDGIEALDDGTLVVSDFTGNRVCAVSPDRRDVRTLAEVESPADIGIDRARMLLYVPQFTKDRVVVFRLVRRR